MDQTPMLLCPHYVPWYRPVCVHNIGVRNMNTGPADKYFPNRRALKCSKDEARASTASFALHGGARIPYITALIILNDLLPLRTAVHNQHSISQHLNNLQTSNYIQGTGTRSESVS